MKYLIHAIVLTATLATAQPNQINHGVTFPSSFRDQLDVSAGEYDGITVVHKFGRNESVGTTTEPISLGGIYRTPTNAVSLEVVSNDADDTAAGAGARSLYVEGLASDFTLQSETVDLSGLSAAALTNTYVRLFRAYVETSGTYAVQTNGSHQGVITIRESGGGDTWATINDVTIFPKGQTQIACYTVPAGYSAYIPNIQIHVESSKPCSLFLFQRRDADDVTPPYSAMRLVQEWDGVDGQEDDTYDAPLGPFPEKTDVGFMGRVAATAAKVSVDFEIILVKDR